MAGALPAVAGSASFTIDMTGEYLAVTAADGSVQLHMQPFSGTMQPFGQCQAALTPTAGTPAFVFTLANGMTITAAVAFQYGTSPAAPTPVTGTINGGSGIFEGASGTFAGTITANTSTATATTLPLTLTASGTLTAPKAPSGMSVLPSVVTFNVPNGSTAAVTENLVLNNQGLDSESFQVSVATTGGGNWLSASPGSGSVLAAKTSSIAVTADPAAGSALKPGLYEGQVTVTYGTVPIAVAIDVQLIVGGLGANLFVSQTGLTFQAGVGGSPSHSLTFLVENRGTGNLAELKATTSVTGGGANWLSAAITPVPGNPQSSTVAVSVNSAPAIGGNYYGRVDLTLPGAANSPQSVAVVLQALTGPLPDVVPTGVVFTSSHLYGSPDAPTVPQTVKLTNLSAHAVNFTVTGGSGVSGGVYGKSSAPLDWLTFSPASGMLGPGGGTGSVTVSVPAACFGAGDPCQLWFNQFGGVNIHYVEDNYTAVVIVGLYIPDLLGTLGVTGSIVHGSPKLAANCVPSQVSGVFTSLPSGFQATVGFPTPIEVKILDSCAQAMNAGTVVATFSNLDPAVALTPIGDGLWDGTWTPRNAAMQATITVQSAESDTVSGMLQLAGAVAANTSTPIAYAGGIVNAASGASTIAPGTFIAIYGADFGATSVASGAPFPAQLGGTQVLLGGEPLPLYFTSSGQIDAIVPYDITPNSAQQLIVQTGTAVSVPQTVMVGTAQPGIFTQNASGSGAGAILVQDSAGNVALNTATHPAGAGDALVIFCTGLGTVSPSVPAGSAAPGSTLSWADNAVTVTVGGVNAQVLFYGLAPGWVGLYQVNVLVPAGIAPGPNVAVVLTAAGAASAPVTVAIQ